uniref:Uncharacterized protein n=1 Tax=Knipowitschia caucasica TaxID=637954 RepID=A0AAV2MPB2_KNICA
MPEPYWLPRRKHQARQSVVANFHPLFSSSFFLYNKEQGWVSRTILPTESEVAFTEVPVTSIPPTEREVPFPSISPTEREIGKKFVSPISNVHSK